MAQAHVAGPPVKHSRDVVWAWVMFALLPSLLWGGFMLGMALVGDPNDPLAPHGWEGAWRVVVLWATLEVVPLLGIFFVLRAARRSEPGGRAALIANALVFMFFVGVTLVGGLLDVVG